MTYYQQYTGKPLVQNALVIPLQYLAFGNEHDVSLLVKIEKDIGKGASKHVQQAIVLDFIGRIPLPEIASLKGKRIAIYRPRGDFHIFFNDIIAIVKLGQLQIKEYNAKSNIVKIRGHSLYINEDYQGTEQDYSRLLYEGYLNLKIAPEQLVRILQKALISNAGTEKIMEITQEVLDRNDLINSPFMIADILPYSLLEGFTQLDDNAILENVYQMVYTIASYASEGIYFRDLQPDNFRMNEKFQVKLIDPSYIDSSVPIESRYALFIKQTTPEYLPNVFSYFLRNNEQEKIMHYFGKFTEGVCIGMLERVIRRAFLPGYMSEKYDSLYLYNNPKMRIEKVIQLHFQEDVDFFHDMLQSFPTPEHFQEYHESLVSWMRKEGRSYEMVMKIPSLLVALRQFSYPVFTSQGCQSLLLDDYGQPITIHTLSGYVANILQLKATSTPQTVSFVPKDFLDKDRQAVPKIPAREKLDIKEQPMDTTKIMRPGVAKSWETKKYINPTLNATNLSTEVAPLGIESQIPVSMAFPYPQKPKATMPEIHASQDTKKSFPKTQIFSFQNYQGSDTSKPIAPTMIRPATPPAFPQKVVSEQEDSYLRGKESPKSGVFPTTIRPAPIPFPQETLDRQDSYLRGKESPKSGVFPTTVRPAPIPFPQETLNRQDVYLRGKENPKSGVFPTTVRPASFTPSRVAPVPGSSGMETERRPLKESPYLTKAFSVPLENMEAMLDDRLPPNAIVVPPPGAKINPGNQNLMATEKMPALDKQIVTQRLNKSNIGDASVTFDMSKKTEVPLPADSLARYSSARIMQKQETRRFEKNIRQLMEKIKTRLSIIKSVIEENPAFEERLRQRILEILASGTTYQCVEDFLCNSEAMLHSYEENFELLRYAQDLVPSNILSRLEYIAPSEIKKHFQSNPAFAAKCKKILCRYLVRIVKTRFLITADSMLDIFKMFPKKEEDLMEFICKYDLKNCFNSINELPYAVFRDITNISSGNR